MSTIIDVLIKRHMEIRNFLSENAQISLASDSDDEFRKILVLSIASYFESLITDALVDLAKNTKSDLVWNFVKNKAISRQYHTYFDWKGRNVNMFLGLFGDSFKTKISRNIDEDNELKIGSINFLNLGNKRNILIHENFASASIDWSVEEITEKYKSSLKFINFLLEKMRNNNEHN